MFNAQLRSHFFPPSHMQSYSSTLEARYQARIHAINTRLSLRNCNWCKIENEISALDEALTNLTEPNLQERLFEAFYELHAKTYGAVHRKSISALLGYASACLSNNSDFKALRLLKTAHINAIRLKGNYSNYAFDIQELVNEVRMMVIS
jgi:hypothetical protein